MDVFDPPTLQIVGGWLLVAFLFVLREIASGALKEAGKELWADVRQRHAPRPGSPRCGAVRRCLLPSISREGRGCPGRAPRCKSTSDSRSR